MSDVREAIKNRHENLSLVGLWEIEKNIVNVPSPFQPHLWHWSDIQPHMADVGKAIAIDEAERRVVILSNPGASRRHHTTNTLYVSLSIYNPGEIALVHRHTPNASRFVLQGGGGYTTIEGEKCTMNRGDLIVTPAGTWHDHGNEGTEPVIWVDVLDLPLTESMGGSHFEHAYYEPSGDKSNSNEPIKKGQQTIRHPVDHSRNIYGVGGLRPTFLTHLRGKSIGTPMFLYRWEDTADALNRMRDYEGSPFDGIMLEYTNPANGDSVTTTMSFNAQLLRPGEVTQAHRQACSTLYCCIKGKGRTTVGDKVMEWGPNDLFVIPNWAPHKHANADAKEDAILYSVSDIPAMKHLGLYREEACAL